MKSKENEFHKTAETGATKQPWEPMKLSYIGHISELVQGGAKTKPGGDTDGFSRV